MKKMFRLPAGRQGFTIVELIIYAGILTIFLYVLTNIFTEVLDMQLESETQSAVIQDSRYILARFAYDIGRASAIVTPAALGDQTSTLELTIGGTNYTYSLIPSVNGNLVLSDTNNSGAVNGFGTTVSGLTFRRYGNLNGKNGVRIVFTLTSTTQRISGPEIRDYQATIGLR
jgi:hypothetical protein